MHSARAWLAPLLLVLLFVGLRLVLLEADAPTRYPTGLFAQELIVEGPAKAHEARRFGLFGTFATKEADSYHIWSVQSPAYVLPLAGFFRVFGVGYASLRIFCALAAALGLLALFQLGRRHANPLVAPIACLLVAVSFFDVQLTRGALLEPYLNGLLALAFLGGILALRSLPWMLLCELAFGAALLTKQTAIFAFPVLAAIGVAAHLRARARGEPAWQHAASLGVGLTLAGLLLFYVLSPAYWETVQWNFGHMIVGEERHEELRLGALQLGAIFRRLGSPSRWVDGFLFIAPLAPLALFQIGRTVSAAIRRKPVDVVDLAAAGWLICALFALQLTEHVRPRFSLIVLPPTALLTASCLAWIARLDVRPLARLAPLALAAAVVLLTDLRWQWSWWSDPTYEIRTAGEQLRTELDEDSVVVGAWASPLAFDTEADVFYVKGPFNTSKEALAGLGITHLLLRDRDAAGGVVARHFRKPMQAKEERLVVKVLKRPYTLYELPAPLGSGAGAEEARLERSSPVSATE